MKLHKEIFYILVALLAFWLGSLALFTPHQALPWYSGSAPQSSVLVPTPEGRDSDLRGRSVGAYQKLGEAAMDSQPTIVMVFGGDVMLGRRVAYELNKAGDFSIPFQNIKQAWHDADIVMVNLESPLLKNCPIENSSTMRFCAPLTAASALHQAGINLVSFANNHSLDYGQAGIKDTNQYLSQNNITVVNQGQEVITYVKGKTIGFLSYNLTWGNVSEQDLRFKIQDLRKKVDFLVVNYHWGQEYQDFPTAEQKAVAHLSLDSGADLVVGHHPHWIQPVEEYQGPPTPKASAGRSKYIFYSLGNLVFDQMWSEKTRQGELVKIYLEKDNTVSYQIYSTQISNWVEVRLAGDK